jgi:hypothetical protein
MTRQEPGNDKQRSTPRRGTGSSRTNRGAPQEEHSQKDRIQADAPGLTSTPDRAQNIRNLLKELGLNKTGLSKLSDDSVTKLAILLQSQGQRSDLIAAMFNAVAETAPDRYTTRETLTKRLERFVAIVDGYRGSFPILRSFIIQLGQQNPFIAAERAQITVLPEKQNNVRGASGHILSGVTYMTYDPEVPTSTTGFFSGKQAIVQIFKAWHPERLDEESKRCVRDRRHKQLRKALGEIDLENLTLSEIEASPDVKGEIRSHIISRNLAVYDELRKAIEQCKTHLSSLIYGGDIVLPGLNSLKVSQDPGRQFFGWFEDHFRENENAPIGIKIAYQSIVDEDIALTPEEEAHYLRGLLAYQRVNSFIDKETALGGLVRDLKEYDALTVDDELRLNPAIEKARTNLQAAIQTTPTELSIAEFASMLENAAMVQFRQAMNRRILDSYREEFEAALKLFDFVSFEKDTWREDALGDSVPMERLKRHLYGAKVGVEKSWYGSDKKRAALGQADFRHIMDAQFLKRLIVQEEKLLNAQPIEQFRAMVEGVVVAYRKAKFLEARLTEYGTTPDGLQVVQTLNREDMRDTLDNWKPVLPIGGTYKPAERWFNHTGEPKPTLRTLSEIAVRITDRKSYFFSPTSTHKDEFRDKYMGHIAEIEQFANAGLYRPDMDPIWRTIESKIASFVPTSEHRELLDRAVRLYSHPMVFRSYEVTMATLSRKFLTPQEFKNITTFVEVEAGLTEVCEGYNAAALGELRARLGDRLGANLLEGGVRTLNDGKKQLTLRELSFASFAGAVKAEPRYTTHLGEYLNPKLLTAALDSLDESYISTKELGKDWIQRAKTLCSKEGAAVLSNAGYALVDRPTFLAARDVRIWDSYYVTKDLADEVNRLLPSKGN